MLISNEQEANSEINLNPPDNPENIAAKERDPDSISTKSCLNSILPAQIEIQDGGQIRGRKSNYKNATDPDKIEQAKKILQANNYQLECLLEISEFKGYDRTSDFRRYLKKFLLNNKPKKSKVTSATLSEHSTPLIQEQMQEEVKQVIQEDKNSLPCIKSGGQVRGAQIQINQGAIVSYERLLTDFQNFKSSSILERAQILQEIVLRNTQSLYQFLDLFKNTLDSNSTQGLFSLLIDLINNYNNLDQDSRSRILLSAFSFYSGEVLQIEENLLRDSCILLIKQPNVLQALGIANCVFVNEIQSFAKYEDIVKKLEISNANIILLMGGTFSGFEIDSQVRQLIPSSLHILNVPFISTLKKDSGLGLIREIPPACTPYFTKICALCNAQKLEDLIEYIQQTRSTFLQKLEMIDQDSILCFMKGLAERLETRDPQWVGQIEKIKKLQSQLIEAQVEKGVSISSSIIKNCLNGDCSELQRVLHLPKAMEAFSEETISELFRLFERTNIAHPLVQKFNELPQQQRLGVISKNEHLVQRDFVKYERVIKGMGLNANLNGFSKDKGVYFYTLPQLKKQLNNQKLINVWADSIVIVDEYDWIMLDGSVDNIMNLLKFFRQAHTIIGFSGSTPSLTEETCLKLTFNTTPILFPSLDQLKGDKKTQLADVLVNTNQTTYIAKLKEIIDDQIKYSPVLIVASDSYRIIEQGLSANNRDFYALSRNAASVIESVIEGRYLMRNAEKQYGVYLFNEAHGRGTDIQTNDEINSNGGSFLIIADIFSRRSEEQIIGRIGRLNTKGKWQRVLYRSSVKDSADQLLFVEQNSIELQLNQKYCKIQSILQELIDQEQMAEESDLCVANLEIQEANEKIEASFQAQEDKENPEDQDIIKEADNKEDHKQADIPVEENKNEIEEEVIQEKPSKLGFYQPSIIELIEEKMSKNPVLQNLPFEEVKQRAKNAMKRNLEEVSKASSQSRSGSRESKRKPKRGRPVKAISDFFENSSKEKRGPIK